MINKERVGVWFNDDGTIGKPDPSNSYRYVGNNPINLVDPTGLAAAYPFNSPLWTALTPDASVSWTISPTESGESGSFIFKLFASKRAAHEIEATITYKPGRRAPASSTIQLVQVVKHSHVVDKKLFVMSPDQVGAMAGFSDVKPIMVTTGPSYGWHVDRHWGPGVINPKIFFNDQQPTWPSSETGLPVKTMPGIVDDNGNVIQPTLIHDPTRFSAMNGDSNIYDFVIGAYDKCAKGDKWLGFVRWGAGDDHRFFNTRYTYVDAQTDDAPAEFRDALKAFLAVHPDPSIKLP